MLFLAFIFLTIPCLAQITSLATVYDGSRLYLTTNSPLASAPGPVQGRIFVIDSQGLRLFRERQKSPVSGSFNDPYWLSYVDVSSDGGLLSYTGTTDRCNFSSLCATFVYDFTTVESFAGKPEREISGFLNLSPNGRFAYRETVHVGGTGGVLDLVNGGFYPIRYIRPRGSAGRFLANDGTLVWGSGSALWIARPSEEWADVYDNPQEQIQQAMISADAQRIVFTSVWTTQERQFLRLRVFDRQTQQATTLVESLGDVLDPVWSDDGETILFRCAAQGQGPIQAWVIRRDGSGLRQITQEGYGVQRAILSGDGKVAFAHTFAEGVLRIDLLSGEQSSWIPNTFTVRSRGFAVPGSLYRLEGSFLSLVRFTNMPVLDRLESSILIQVPWETDLTIPREAFALDVDLKAAVVTGYPFTTLLPRFPSPILRRYPVFYDVPVNSQPARPGDVVQLYASGLGPVDRAVPTGEVTPSDGVLSRVTEPFACLSRNQAVPVLFAGLAPGMIGVYQVNLQIPPDAVASTERPNVFQVVCSQTAVAEIPFRPNR